MFYNKLSYRQKRAVHSFLRDLFAPNQTIPSGDWFVSFCGKQIALPLAGTELNFAWDRAVSIVGNDVEVKQTYENLIQEAPYIHVFYDVGANFGLHSLLFLSQGIKTYSFEPNPVCHDYLERVSRRNELACHVCGIALGETNTTLQLHFPETETWRGTTVTRIQEEWDSTGVAYKTIEVPQRTIDEFVEETGDKPDLIKIDTEGAELSVLRGGVITLKSCKPSVIFESFPTSRRGELYSFLEALEYCICSLPFSRRAKQRQLDRNQFNLDTASNFICVPIKQVRR